ncbi:hypothetical protein GCM10029978_116420 [Actinoallomurus acanthiterrae]
MGGVSARRLRKVPAVVLPRTPEPQRLLSAVRLFDPEAAPVDGGITFGAGVRLAGPHPVTPDLAAKSNLPQGQAFVASDSGPFQNWLARGLARRFGGYAHLPQEFVADDPTEVVVVHTPRKVSPGELAARISAFITGLVPEGPEKDGSFFLATPHAPVNIRCDGPEVPSLRWLLPLALGPMRREPGLHGYRFGIAGERDPRLVRLAATAALELAQGVGGVTTDLDRFRVFEPGDPGLYR